MKPNILDLREERCPMALLLAKRHIAKLSNNEVATLYISDPSSKRDIERFLQSKSYKIECEDNSEFCAMQVTKEA
ncbi:sulfurtransferase TusA family protein [Vibrio paucivorans]